MKDFLKLNILLSPTLAPTDMIKLNHFAEEYNEYIARLKENNLDIGQWRKVRKAYEVLD